MSTKKQPIRSQDAQGLKYFDHVRKLLGRLHDHKPNPNRKLHYDEFATLLMLHFLSPTLSSLRALQQASGLRNVKKKLGIRRASLGSLSEAQHVFDPKLLADVFQELAAKVAATDAHGRPSGLPEELELLAVDGTLLRALPRMMWAHYVDPEHRAAKLHLEFNVLKSAPTGATLTDANTDERKVLAGRLASGKVYLLDAGYARYALLEAIRQVGSSFVLRLHDNAVYDVLEERALTDDDAAAGVEFDRVVRLGGERKQADISEPVRVVKVHVQSPPQMGKAQRPSKVSSKKTFRHRPEEYDVLVVTDLMDLSAETVAMLYRWRWTIELFFRWFKCVLGFSHLVLEGQGGVAMQVYCALIVSLLVVLWTGRKPTKRTWEMIQLYFQGWASLEELEAHLAGLKPVQASQS